MQVLQVYPSNYIKIPTLPHYSYWAILLSNRRAETECKHLGLGIKFYLNYGSSRKGNKSTLVGRRLGFGLLFFAIILSPLRGQKNHSSPYLLVLCPTNGVRPILAGICKVVASGATLSVLRAPVTLRITRNPVARITDSFPYFTRILSIAW
jgi:hypothetical protein